MNDMRLPGLNVAKTEPTPNAGGGDTPRDPAQAFDAVMSRFANGNAAAPKSGPADAGADKRADAQGKTPAAPTASPAHAGARPVARSKAKSADDAACEADDASHDATPAAVAQAVANAAQLAAQDPTLAATANAVATPSSTADPKQTGATAAATPAAASAIEVLAGQAQANGQVQAEASAARKTEQAGLDAADTVGSDDARPATRSGGKNRAPVAAKDTLRIDAPLTRPFDAARADSADRLAGAAGLAAPVVNARTAPAAGTETMAQAIASAAAAGSAAPSTYSIAHAAVGAPVGSAGFGIEVAQRVLMFAGQKVQRAEISVTPADLGPIAVSIEVRGHEATLAFAASSHATRAAIEDALPRLRDMFSAQGLQLAGTHVGSEPRRDPYRPTRTDATASRNASVEGVSASSAPVTTQIRRGVNLIDIEV
jgi:flagellar hook-length control protein FliK